MGVGTLRRRKESLFLLMCSPKSLLVTSLTKEVAQQAKNHGFRVEQPIAALLAGFPNGRHLKWPLVKLSGLAKVTGLCHGIAVKKERLLDTHDHVGSGRKSC